jgi:hypothetical protein
MTHSARLLQEKTLHKRAGSFLTASYQLYWAASSNHPWQFMCHQVAGRDAASYLRLVQEQQNARQWRINAS